MPPSESEWSDVSEFDHSHLSHSSQISGGSFLGVDRGSVLSGQGGSIAGSTAASGESVLDYSTADMHCCVFRVAGELYGLNVSAVGEVFQIESLVRVPLAPSGVIGLTNLRGVALAVVDLEALLDVGSADSDADGIGPALVLRLAGMKLAVSNCSVESVVPVSAGSVRESDAVDEHPAVAGFLPQASGDVVSVLDIDELARRVQKLRLRQSGDATEGL